MKAFTNFLFIRTPLWPNFLPNHFDKPHLKNVLNKITSLVEVHCKQLFAVLIRNNRVFQGIWSNKLESPLNWSSSMTKQYWFGTSHVSCILKSQSSSAWTGITTSMWHWHNEATQPWRDQASGMVLPRLWIAPKEWEIQICYHFPSLNYQLEWKEYPLMLAEEIF